MKSGMLAADAIFETLDEMQTGENQQAIRHASKKAGYGLNFTRFATSGRALPGSFGSDRCMLQSILMSYLAKRHGHCDTKVIMKI